MMSNFSDMMSSSSFFDVAFFHLSGLVAGLSFMTILLELKQYFFKELTRNLEIRNTPVWVLSNIRWLGQVGISNFDMNVSNEKLLNAAKWQEFLPFLSYEGNTFRGGKNTLFYPDQSYNFINKTTLYKLNNYAVDWTKHSDILPILLFSTFPSTTFSECCSSDLLRLTWLKKKFHDYLYKKREFSIQSCRKQMQF